MADLYSKRLWRGETKRMLDDNAEITARLKQGKVIPFSASEIERQRHNRPGLSNENRDARH